MNQVKNFRTRCFYRSLRIVTGIMTAMVGSLITLMTVTALMGDTEILADFVDLDTNIAALSLVAQIGLVAANLLALATFWLLFRSIDRFLKYAERGEFFLDSTEKALSRMGRAMIMLYLVFLSFDVVVPMLVAPHEIYDNIIDFIVSFVDLNVLTLLIGMVLIALAGALREGRVAQDELKQIV